MLTLVCAPRRKSCLVVASVVVCALVAGCGKQPVARVNGRTIDAKTLDRAMEERVREHARQKADVDRERLKRAVLGQLIEERLVLDGAAKRGIRVSDDEVNAEIDSTAKKMGKEAFRRMLDDSGEGIGNYRRKTRERLIADRLIDSLEKESPVTEEEMREYYRSSLRPFIRPARLQVKMVEMASYQEALRAIREMRTNHLDFDKATRTLGAEGKATVIDYGWVNADFFSPGISEGLMNLRVGQYGGPYKGTKNFYLIKLKEREPERIATFDEVREDIRRILTAEKRAKVYSAWLEGVRKHSTIELSLK